MRSRLLVAGAALVIGLSGGGLAVAATAPQAGDVSVSAAGEFDFSRPETVATNLNTPWGLAFLPDGSALVAERNSARVLRLRPGQSPQQVTTISGVSAGGEAGLLGLAVSPTFAQDNYVYAYFTSSSDNRIVRFRLDTPQTQTPILTGLARANFHDGGRIAFGPDGMLYAGVGDAGQTANSQNPQSRNGKILRMRPDGGVPADNPTAGSLVYSLGHRNVQGLAWDAQGRLYASEFGQNTWDEVNQIVPGGNYGWPTVEGRGNDPRFRDPIVTWTTAEASPSGATIDGNVLFVAALRGARLWTVPLTGNGGAGAPVAQLVNTYGRLRTVERAPDGSLWVTTSNRDGRGTPATTDDRVLRFPPVGVNPTNPPTTPPTNPPTTPPTNPPTTPPTSGPTNPPTTPPTQGPGGCSATVSLNQWNGGFVATVRVTAGSSGTNGWSVGMTLPSGATVTNAWNTQRSGNSGAVTFTNVSYNGRIAAGQSTEFGFQGTGTGSGMTPTCTAS
ncbi:PQQ-dependent sugar dehydrogenase [Plantactinospora sp. B5E13]|uniref:PQQ-dependent sugar dehydrogenase n=1 Tax=Plantactinospora sp. B5E13 TaxID=3153758 RepID=UPI00325E44E6